MIGDVFFRDVPEARVLFVCAMCGTSQRRECNFVRECVTRKRADVCAVSRRRGGETERRVLLLRVGGRSIDGIEVGDDGVGERERQNGSV